MSTPTRLDVTTLRHLGNGKSLEQVAAITGRTREEVLDLASRHGYPAQDKLAWAADLIAEKLDAAEAELPAATPIRPPAANKPPTPRPADTPSTSPGALTKPDEIRVLINAGKGHDSKRIQNAANRVLDAVDRLKQLLREDEEKHAAKRAEQAAKAKARAEVERLEKELAAAKAKLRGKPAAEEATPAKVVRTWARENGVECPETGKVPGHVRAAYDAAHRGAAS